ncbi:hypothetical protein QS306_02240 [Paraburkholderia bonniea]|uniref:hypothetical protein n=1 Tax=Paraburkholderia bonniea TaxID=2152891 RepID=UPI001FEB014F|nr:hypothetical protein [Paraburkholderia bonniea]WJF90524.1 hypothetical protein QS306_02240 [Paraburkholderia bonniea]WJF93839.1 hypothetical protein QS308_02240 [Paraburkholderia bonniea]
MHTRNIQTFLMVSAAFFAMNVPVRAHSAGALANAVTCSTRAASAQPSASTSTSVAASASLETRQNSLS